MLLKNKFDGPLWSYQKERKSMTQSKNCTQWGFCQNNNNDENQSTPKSATLKKFIKKNNIEQLKTKLRRQDSERGTR